MRIVSPAQPPAGICYHLWRDGNGPLDCKVACEPCAAFYGTTEEQLARAGRAPDRIQEARAS